MQFGSVLLVFLVGVSACSDPVPAPGPVPLGSPEQMAGFLSSSRFGLVGDDTDWWEFEEAGDFRAHIQGGDLTGSWSATLDELHLSDLDEGPDRVLPLRWLDGKLNIEIDGRQYRRRGALR